MKAKLVREDFDTLLSRIRMDLSDAQQKVTDLKNILATIDIPTEEQPVSEQTLARLVANTRHEYTDASLRAELAERGADDDMIERLLAA